MISAEYLDNWRPAAGSQNGDGNKAWPGFIATRLEPGSGGDACGNRILMSSRCFAACHSADQLIVSFNLRFEKAWKPHVTAEPDKSDGPRRNGFFGVVHEFVSPARRLAAGGAWNHLATRTGRNIFQLTELDVSEDVYVCR
jgi:hypothetical protein